MTALLNTALLNSAMSNTAASRSATAKSIGIVACCLYCALLSTAQAQADTLAAAHRLLRVADVKHHYEVATAEQTRAIIRTYASIVSMSASVDLPDALLQKIRNCYAQVYAWENFEHGLAQILAENLSGKELRLLTDFYNNLGLPPFEIQNFKQTIAKAGHIQEVSLDYMWANSASCVEQDAELILDYVATGFLPEDL